MLPFLSGTLSAVINSLAEDGNPIAKHIVEINCTIEEVRDLERYTTPHLYKVIITKLIEPMITSEVMMLSVRIGGDDANISFLPKDKLPEYTDDGNWSRRNRQEGKPAKIFQKAITKEFKQQEWECFSNAFKAAVCNCNQFELVSGEQIRYWYNQENYYQVKGTLGNSCMRYEECQPYFDVYVDHAKMLISLKDGKLTGRAIVWEIDDKVYLDRVYTCYDYLYNCFIDYAKEHKWIIRKDNSLLQSGDVQLWRHPEDNYLKLNNDIIRIKLDKTYQQFPYVDSLRYYDPDNNILSTDNSECVALDHTDGDWEESYVECDNCGHRFVGSYDDLPDELHWSEWYDGYLCDDCCYYCDYLEDYIPNSVESARVMVPNSRWGHYYNVPVEVIKENEITNYSDDAYGFVKIGDVWYEYQKDEIKFNPKTNSFELNSRTIEPQVANNDFVFNYNNIVIDNELINNYAIRLSTN